MHKIYRIFVSSASDDLKNERKELVKRLFEMGALPVYLESFDRNEKNDQKIVRKIIDSSDYFINLIAHRIGEAAGSTYALEAELSWAEKSGIPVISLIIGENARWKDAKKEKDNKACKALDELKKRLMYHNHDTWMSSAEICDKAINLLVREMNLNPREGWVPGREAIDPALANELAILLRENEALKTQIKLEGRSIANRVQEQMKRTLKLLAVNRFR